MALRYKEIAMAEQDHIDAKIAERLELRMPVIREEIHQRLEGLVSKHKLDCPGYETSPMVQRIHKELFNGDDGKSGFIAEMRSFVGDWNARTKQDDNHRKRRWVAAAVIIPCLCIVFAQPVQSGWKKVESLSDLAGKAGDIIKLTDDWKRYYENPPVHQMDPAPVVTPPSAQTLPKQKPAPKKPQKSFFEYGPQGVGLMQDPPPLQFTDTRKPPKSW